MRKAGKKPKQTEQEAAETAESGTAASESAAEGPAAEGPAESGGGSALVEPLEQAVERLTEEAAHHKDRHLRLAAEFDNFRKRTSRERTEIWSRAQADVVSSILDALDDLGRVAHLEPDQTTVADVISGVELVERKILRELEGAGLKRVGVSGEAFDPNHHEAVATAPAPNAKQDNTVAAVLQPGYRFGGVLLRPARVRVFVLMESQDDGGA